MKLINGETVFLSLVSFKSWTRWFIVTLQTTQTQNSEKFVKLQGKIVS